MVSKCHYCGMAGNRFKVANAYLWCGWCPLPAPERPARLAMFPKEIDKVPEAQLLTANPEE